MQPFLDTLSGNPEAASPAFAASAPPPPRAEAPLRAPTSTNAARRNPDIDARLPSVHRSVSCAAQGGRGRLAADRRHDPGSPAAARGPDVRARLLLHDTPGGICHGSLRETHPHPPRDHGLAGVLRRQRPAIEPERPEHTPSRRPPRHPDPGQSEQPHRGGAQPGRAQPGQPDAGAQARADGLRDRGGTGSAGCNGAGEGRPARGAAPPAANPVAAPPPPRPGRSSRRGVPGMAPPTGRLGEVEEGDIYKVDQNRLFYLQHLPRLRHLRPRRPQEAAAAGAPARCSATRSRCSSAATPSTPCCATPST